MKILQIDCSVRTTGSKTRELSATFIDLLKNQGRVKEVVSLDLSANPPPHVHQNFVAAHQTSPEERTVEQKRLLKDSDAFIRLLKSADVLVLGVPMYNFSIPSTLKAFMDHVVRIGETFAFDGNQFSGLLKNKKAIFCTSRGGVYRNGPLKNFDQQEPYLRSVFAFMGITEVQFIHAEGQDFASDHWKNTSMSDAKARLAEIADHWH